MSAPEPTTDQWTQCVFLLNLTHFGIIQPLQACHRTEKGALRREGTGPSCVVSSSTLLRQGDGCPGLGATIATLGERLCG
jgi:hypothetical protein